MKGRVLSVVAAVLLLGASDAHAHLVSSGFGPFYDGLAHPFVVAEDLLPLVALALLGGLGGPRRGRWALLTLTFSWGAGIAVAAFGWWPSWASWPAWATAALTVALGASVAADRAWPVGLVAALAAVAGATHGLGNGRELSAVTGGALATAGIVGSVFAISSLLAGQVASLREPWARVVVRVAGSWIAAIGLLTVGWALR